MPCTNFPGVASLHEIENVIDELGLEPTLLEDDMMKVITFGDQWIGYDDNETIEMKKRFASSMCFGGTMIWSVDLYSGSGSGDTPDGGGSDQPGSPSGGGGQSGSTEGNGEAIVYIDPSIWTDENPEINCHAPCSFVLPPKQLQEPTTISIPPITTSLEIAYPRTTTITKDGTSSISSGYTRITITTTITVPPITTTEVEVWGHTIDDTETDANVTFSFFITSSVRPPIITITNKPDPEDTSSTQPLVTRTIHPPPFPYIRPSGTSTNGVDFPIVTFKPGDPKPVCRPPAICGSPCLLFCSAPCIPGSCPDSDPDFPDPIAPGPPKPPVPSPPPGQDPPQPEDAEDDQEEEEDEERCEFEFNLPPGGDDAGSPTSPAYLTGRTTRTPDPTIAPPKPTPTPSPPPDPEPPKPNPDTEQKKCYDSGALIGRGEAIDAVEKFCEYYDKELLDDSDANRRQVGGIDSGNVGGFVYVVQSVTVRNGCRFNFDRQECRRIMRIVIDGCDTSSTRFKQGGTVEDNCSIWRFDPQVDVQSILCLWPAYNVVSGVLDPGSC